MFFWPFYDYRGFKSNGSVEVSSLTLDQSNQSIVQKDYEWNASLEKDYKNHPTSGSSCCFIFTHGRFILDVEMSAAAWGFCLVKYRYSVVTLYTCFKSDGKQVHLNEQKYSALSLWVESLFDIMKIENLISCVCDYNAWDWMFLLKKEIQYKISTNPTGHSCRSLATERPPAHSHTYQAAVSDTST